MNRVSDFTNAVCAGLAVFAIAYAMWHLFPLFGYALFVIGMFYGYAWLNRKVNR